MKNTLLFILMSAFIQISLGQQRTDFVQVTHVRDADTFDGTICDSFPVVVRLLWVDAIEHDQPMGDSAHAFADSLLKNQLVIVHWSKKDVYGRLLGEVILSSGDTLNAEVVKAGWAMQYSQYGKNDFYMNLQYRAMMSRVGIWSMPGAKAPWLWREERSKKK